MLSCIIVDDEPLALDLLEDNIGKIPFLELKGRCKSATEALTVLQNDSIDLVFCDIQMPGLNGLQLIRSLVTPPMFIMITAYENYAVEGFNLDVVDYLLKPVSFDRFLRACNKALEKSNSRNAVKAAPVSKSEEIPTPGYIFLPVDYSMVKIMLSEVRMIEALKDYIKIHFTNHAKRPLLVRMSMKAMEEMLPGAAFIRIHKSYIVSIGEISAIRKNALYINELELPIGEQYKDAVLKLTSRPI
ncbi:LytR/AlgR family response regulator transcription factor [Taibaiella soli]|uniref:DNA-binding response regulator n=1 Tax=Taibaiella soli TaxID=1649169 RepID=A0A2W2AHG7_9BACT|nr:LytTR family DNA-binding domain-containing protein [Taibaiella soli]PZF74721.1 DNA-binding response regulator [Taibaiella soli]